MTKKPTLQDQLNLADALAKLHELGVVVDDSIRPLAEKNERDETRAQQLAQLSKIFEGKPHYQRVAPDQATLEALLQLVDRSGTHQAAPAPKPARKVQATEPPKKGPDFSQLDVPVINAEPKPKAGLGRSRILRPREN